MANSINETSRILKRVFLSDIDAHEGEHLTPLISGPHGIGKSQICKAAAKALGGYGLTMEASMLSEGDVVGLPVVSATADGGNEVSFVMHNIFASVQRLEKKYYEIAKTTGFLNGKIKVDNDGDTIIIDKDGNITKVSQASFAERVLLGANNEFKFGEELPFEIKLQLLESHEIRPVVILIDELNRTDNQTMKELMNIILNHVVNGYKLPWWCFICGAVNPATQDSMYATNEMDPAQLDRFIRFNVSARLSDWVDYSLDNGLNRDLVQAVAATDGLLMDKVSTSSDGEVPMTPSPRGWSMLAHYMDRMNAVNNSNFFTPEERKFATEDFREIVFAKVGTQAGRSMLTNLESKENRIKPEDILNGKSPEVDSAVKAKFARQKPIQAKITTDAVLRYITESFDDFAKLKNNNDEKLRLKYINYCRQVNDYMQMLDNATKLVFIKKIASSDLRSKSGKMIFVEIGSYFAKDALAMINDYNNNIRQING